MWPDAPASTDGHHPEVVELHLFVPAQDGTTRSVLREDDGLTFAAAEGGAPPHHPGRGAQG
jgi:alpha-glucosidase